MRRFVTLRSVGRAHRRVEIAPNGMRVRARGRKDRHDLNEALLCGLPRGVGGVVGDCAVALKQVWARRVFVMDALVSKSGAIAPFSR